MRTNVLERNPWLPHVRGQSATRLRLFCLPCAGAGASAFASWPAALPAEIEVAAVQLPGRESRLGEPPIRRATAIVDSVATALAPFVDCPYALFGQSMGAMLAFELAREFRRRGLPQPMLLAVTARSAPQTQHEPMPTSRPDDASFVEQLRRLNGTPAAVLQHAELLELMLPALRADFEVCDTYRYTADAPLACPIVAYGGVQDGEVPAHTVDAWRGQTHGNFRAQLYPGDHFFFRTCEARLLGDLKAELAPLIRAAVL